MSVDDCWPMSEERQRNTIRNAVMELRRFRHNRRSPAWSLIRYITGHGSGYSHEIAKICGINPESTKAGTDFEQKATEETK